LFFRSRFADWIYTSTSEDGCAWTRPQPTQIPNNNSSMQVARLSNGHLVIAFNNTQATTTRGKPTSSARLPLSVALSVDGGRTWPWVRDLEMGQEVPQGIIPTTMAGTDVSDEQKEFAKHVMEYSYPSIVATPDGRLHLSYTFRRRAIKYAEFEESWIKGGGTVGIFPGDGRQAGGPAFRVLCEGREGYAVGFFLTERTPVFSPNLWPGPSFPTG